MPRRLCILPLQTIHVNVSICWLLVVSRRICLADYNLTKIFNAFIRRRGRWAIIYSIFLYTSMSAVGIKIKVRLGRWQNCLVSDRWILIVCIPEFSSLLLLSQQAQLLFDLCFDVSSAHTKIVHSFFRFIKGTFLTKWCF